jgi:hypothetical protein
MEKPFQKCPVGRLGRKWEMDDVRVVGGWSCPRNVFSVRFL